MHAQYAEIPNFKAPLTSLQTIHAEDPMGTGPVNPNIENDIASFAQNDNLAGLIVTAGTRTSLLRDTIVRAVKRCEQRNP